jgi:ferritin-like metal-binding protein YciE
MSLVSLKDLYVAELADLHDAETQSLTLLARLSDLARAPELRQALSRHAEESRLHLERLQLIFTRLSEGPAGQRCSGIAGIVQESDERLNQPATDDVRDAGIIGIVQRIEHYEIAAYGCARTYARRLSRGDEARLLQETLDEERRADRRLTEMAEAHINDDARSEADLHELPRPKKLRYIDASQLDFSRLTDRAALTIRNDADDDLGTFGGMVIDADSHRPHYIVVDAGGLFHGSRYLLPVSEVRFDQTEKLLRVPLAKDVATRYPAFDEEEFQRMDDRALRGYESRLLGFFERRDRRSELDEDFTPPEWLMTGVWIPMTGERAERLRPDTRAFANEFLPDHEQAVAHEGAPGGADLQVRPEADLQVHPAADSPVRPEAERDRAAARPSAPADAPTPPHGEKLR